MITVPGVRAFIIDIVDRNVIAGVIVLINVIIMSHRYSAIYNNIFYVGEFRALYFPSHSFIRLFTFMSNIQVMTDQFSYNAKANQG